MASRKNRAPRCPGCRAPLKMVPGAQIVTCAYCGETLDFSRPPPVPEAPAAPARPAHTWILLAGLMSSIMAGIGVAVFALQAGPSEELARSPIAVTSGAAPASSRKAREKMQWDSYSPVVAADVNQDGTEDVIGRYRILKGSDTELYVGAFDGRTFERLWVAGPFGLWSETAYQHTFMVVVGDRLLVTDVRANAHVLSLAEGKTLSRITLSDKPEWACADPDAPGSVWVSVKDKQHVLVDTVAGSARAAGGKRKPPCLTSTELFGSDCMTQSWHFFVPRGGCAEPSAAPRAAGFQARRVLTDERLSVAVGHRSPGTAVPMVVGFRPGKTKEVSWQRVLPDQDPLTVKEGGASLVDLVDGRLYATYELVNQGWRLIAIDAADGRTLWDVAIPRSKDGSGPDVFTLTPDRVYVPHWVWLDVFDAKTGSHLATLGEW